MKVLLRDDKHIFIMNDSLTKIVAFEQNKQLFTSIHIDGFNKPIWRGWKDRAITNDEKQHSKLLFSNVDTFKAVKAKVKVYRESISANYLNCDNLTNCSNCNNVKDSNNSHNCTHSSGLHNCDDCKGCFNCRECQTCENCQNCDYLTNSKLCSNCIDCDECDNCVRCVDCNGCEKCTDCINCESCYACDGLSNKRYYIYNKQFGTREKYINELKRLGVL